MRLCPNCGNQNDDTGKYCSYCGGSLDQARREIPVPGEPVYDEQLQNMTPTQPLWVTEHYDLSSENDIEKSLTYPIPDTAGNSTAPKKYSSIYHDDTPDVNDADIFDEIADSASLIYSIMPRKAKKWVLAFIIGTLLSIIPFIYVSCTHQAIPTLDNLIGVTTSRTTP